MFSPSALVFLGLGLLYTAGALLFFPAYFTVTLPLVLTAYPAIGKSASIHIWRVLVYLGIAYAFLALDKKPRYGVLALLGSALCVYLLNGGWTYTLYLLLASAVRVALAAPLAEVLAKRPVLIVDESRLMRNMPQGTDVLREFRKDAPTPRRWRDINGPAASMSVRRNCWLYADSASGSPKNLPQKAPVTGESGFAIPTLLI